MSYGAGVVWWVVLGIVVLCLIVWIWNRVWLKMGPDGKPIFAVITLVVIVVAALFGVGVFAGWLFRA